MGQCRQRPSAAVALLPAQRPGSQSRGPSGGMFPSGGRPCSCQFCPEFQVPAHLQNAAASLRVGRGASSRITCWDKGLLSRNGGSAVSSEAPASLQWVGGISPWEAHVPRAVI